MAPGLSAASQRRSRQGRAAAAASPSSPHLQEASVLQNYLHFLPFPHTSSLQREITSPEQIQRFHSCSGFSLSSTSSGPYFIHFPFCASSSDIPCQLASFCITPTCLPFLLSRSLPRSYHMLSCFPSITRQGLSVSICSTFICSSR